MADDPLDDVIQSEVEMKLDAIEAKPSPPDLAPAPSPPQAVSRRPPPPILIPCTPPMSPASVPSAPSPPPASSPPPPPDGSGGTGSQHLQYMSDEERVRRRALARKALTSEFDFLAVPDWVHLHPLLGAYLAEATGTFLYVLTVALVSVNDAPVDDHPETNTTPIPVGFMLMCMVFTFGYISGGHFNPAVTAAVTLSGKMHPVRAAGYALCQCGAALGAGVVGMIIAGNEDIVVPDVEDGGAFVLKGVFAELAYTFALATVVLNVAYSRQQGNFFYGSAIGMVVVAGISAVGGVSGGAFNPAVATGLQAAVCLVGRCSPLMHLWIYWAAPMAGAGIATLLFKNLWQPPAADNAAV